MDGRDLTSVGGAPRQPEPPEGGGDGGQTPTSPPPGDASGAGSAHLPEACDALARAISSTLGAVMRESDSRAEGAIQSQDELALSLDRLTGELDKLLEDAPMPFIMQHAAKISSIRKRVSALNFMLKSIQRRIDNIDRMLSTGVPTDKAPIHDVATSPFTL